MPINHHRHHFELTHEGFLLAQLPTRESPGLVACHLAAVKGQLFKAPPLWKSDDPMKCWKSPRYKGKQNYIYIYVFTNHLMNNRYTYTKGIFWTAKWGDVSKFFFWVFSPPETWVISICWGCVVLPSQFGFDPFTNGRMNKFQELLFGLRPKHDSSI